MNYRLSKFVYEQNRAGKRIQQLSRDEMGNLTEEEVEALMNKDVTKLYELGLNPYLIRQNFRSQFRY